MFKLKTKTKHKNFLGFLGVWSGGKESASGPPCGWGGSWIWTRGNEDHGREVSQWCERCCLNVRPTHIEVLSSRRLKRPRLVMGFLKVQTIINENV